MGRLFVFFAFCGIAVFVGAAVVLISSRLEGFFCVGAYSSRLFCAIPGHPAFRSSASSIGGAD